MRERAATREPGGVGEPVPVLRVLPARGGYRSSGRLATTLDEIRIEALVARQSRSRRERDRAFEEIARLTYQAAELLAYFTGAAGVLVEEIAHAE